jgi:hypothetical protein
MNPEKLMKSVELEREFKIVADDIDAILSTTEAYTACLEMLYDIKEKNEDFIADMQMKQADLLKLVNKLNDIAMQAMAINEQDLVYRIELVKADVKNMMERVRNLYM